MTRIESASRGARLVVTALLAGALGSGCAATLPVPRIVRHHTLDCSQATRADLKGLVKMNGKPATFNSTSAKVEALCTTAPALVTMVLTQEQENELFAAMRSDIAHNQVLPPGASKNEGAALPADVFKRAQKAALADIAAQQNPKNVSGFNPPLLTGSRDPADADALKKKSEDELAARTKQINKATTLNELAKITGLAPTSATSPMTACVRPPLDSTDLAVPGPSFIPNPVPPTATSGSLQADIVNGLSQFIAQRATQELVDSGLELLNTKLCTASSGSDTTGIAPFELKNYFLATCRLAGDSARLDSSTNPYQALYAAIRADVARLPAALLRNLQYEMCLQNQQAVNPWPAEVKDAIEAFACGFTLANAAGVALDRSPSDWEGALRTAVTEGAASSACTDEVHAAVSRISTVLKYKGAESASLKGLDAETLNDANDAIAWWTKNQSLFALVESDAAALAKASDRTTAAVHLVSDLLRIVAAALPPGTSSTQKITAAIGVASAFLTGDMSNALSRLSTLLTEIIEPPNCDRDADCSGTPTTPHCTNRHCAATCPAGLSECGTSCVSLQTDGENCGACGMKCASGQGCSAAKCAASCASGLTNTADGSCVNLKTDNNHCGALTTTCASGQSCSDGKCTCLADLTACGASCVSLQTDVENCGTCANRCDTSKGQVCSAGNCAASCASGLTKSTDGGCVDLQTDNNHCGALDTPCTGGHVCSSGKCICEKGLVLKDGKCVSTLMSVVGDLEPLLKVVPVAIEIANAKSSDDVTKAIESFAQPATEYKLRHISGQVMWGLSARLGVALAAEWDVPLYTVTNKDAMGNAITFVPHASSGVSPGVSMPVGGDISFGFGCGALVIHGQLLDLGTQVSFQLDTGTTIKNSPTIGFAQVFAPGASIGWQFFSSPLLLWLGYEYAPGLRQDINSGNYDAHRFMIGVSIDVPIYLFTLHHGSDK